MKLRYYVIIFAGIVVFSIITFFPLNLTNGNMVLAFENLSESITTLTIGNGKEGKSRFIYDPYKKENHQYIVSMEPAVGENISINHLPIPDANVEISVSPLHSK